MGRGRAVCRVPRDFGSPRVLSQGLWEHHPMLSTRPHVSVQEARAPLMPLAPRGWSVPSHPHPPNPPAAEGPGPRERKPQAHWPAQEYTAALHVPIRGNPRGPNQRGTCLQVKPLGSPRCVGRERGAEHATLAPGRSGAPGPLHAAWWQPQGWWWLTPGARHWGTLCPRRLVRASHPG